MAYQKKTVNSTSAISKADSKVEDKNNVRQYEKKMLFRVSR